MFTTAPQSLCFLRLSAIGDCCHALALVQHIQRHWPTTQLTWVIGKVEAQLFAELLPTVEFIVFDKKQGRKAYQQLRQHMQHKCFDALLNLQANMRANFVSLCIPARKKIGFARERARELQWLFTQVKAPLSSGIHVAEGFMDFAGALGLPIERPQWHLQLPKEMRQWAEAQRDQRPLFILCPSASKAERNWTVEGYTALLNHAHQKGYKTALIGSPAANEIALGEKIAAQNAHIDANYIGKTHLVQLLALIEAAQLVVAPDTGPAHMATIASTPVIGLYAAQTPLRTGPYNDLANVISVYDQALWEETGKTLNQVDWRTRVKSKHAMERITIAEVLAKFDQLTS